MRTLVEMKIENHGNISKGKKSTSILFFAMKIKMMVL